MVAPFATTGRRPTVATNGRFLLRVKHPEQDGDSDAEQFVPKIIHRSGVETALKSLPTKAVLKPHMAEAFIDVPASNANGKVHASVPWGDTRADVELSTCEGTFPTNVDEVTPSAENYTVAAEMNVEYLIQVAKALREVDKARDRMPGTIIIKLYAPPGKVKHFMTEPLRVENIKGDGVAVLMPIDRE